MIREMAKEMGVELNPATDAECSAAEAILDQVAKSLVSFMFENGIDGGVEVRLKTDGTWTFEHWLHDSAVYTATWEAKSIGGLASALDEYPEGNV